ASLLARRHATFIIRISSFDLAFHISNWRESRDWFADSRELSRCDHLIDVFVSCAGFLSEARPRSAPNIDAARFEVALELLAVPLFARLGTAHCAAASMRRAEECFCARCGAYEQIGAGLHAATDDHWLANLAITSGHFLVSRAECARRAFARNEQRLFFSIDELAFLLRGVVRAVVHHAH